MPCTNKTVTVETQKHPLFQTTFNKILIITETNKITTLA